MQPAAEPHAAPLQPGLDAWRALMPEMTAIRHDLHRNPELAFAEHRSAAVVADRLRDWGYEVSCGIGGTGVVGTLRRGSGTRSIGLRADMDALALHEETGLPYASRQPGVMHACGHDGHMAMLLGAARHLGATRRFTGTVHLIFQPAEEKGFDSGAQAMLADGLFTRFPCDYVFALHNHPGLDQGTLAWRCGDFMAAGDRVFVRVRGRGGHAARPHLAVDPVVAAASIVMNLQSLVARNVDPADSAVVTVGRLRAGEALNVIPQHAELGISVRSFRPAVRALLRERIAAIVHGTAAALGAEAEIDHVQGYPVVCNDEQACALAKAAALEVAGPQRTVTDFPALMGSEDFGYLLQACPGALVRIGNGSASAGLHTPGYDFNDGNLAVGAAFLSRLAERHLC